MKKFKLHLAVLGLSAAVFTACGGEDKIKDEPDMEMLTGVLEEQDSTDGFKGTHILIDENDQEIAVRSLAFNLSDEEYLENEVEVMGFFNEEDNVFEITGISVVEELNDSETAGSIVVYKNTDLGFEIEYFDKWDVEEMSDRVIFSAPEPEEEDSESPTTTTSDIDTVEISQFPFVTNDPMGENAELMAFMTQYYPQVSNPESLVNKLGADAVSAVKYEHQDVIDYFLYRNALIYQITFTPGPADSENINVFNDMVRTFRFTGFTVDESENVDNGEEDGGNLPAVDMEFTSFESLPYHFKADYPADWYYAGRNGGGAGGIRHHYGFNTEAIEDDNELIALDVISQAIPSGSTLKLAGKEATKVNDGGGKISIYVEVEGQNFRVSGPQDYEDVMIIMAASITSIEIPEED